MNNFFTQLKTIALTKRLSNGEKQRMRMSLYGYMEQNPIVAAPAPSAPQRPVPSPYYWFSPKFAVPLAVVLLVGLTSGTAFAAQGSLPGDVLYPVKINVNEKMAVALATTPAQKAQVNADLATTRLEEAETLAASGKLDASTSQELANNFTAHAAAATANTNNLSQNDPGAAADLGAQFDSTLAAHSAILAQISDDTKGKSAQGDNYNAIALAVRAQEHDEDTDSNNDNGNQPAVTLALVATATNAEATATPTARVRTFAAKTNGTATSATSAGSTSSPQAAAPQRNSEDAKGNARDAAVAASLETKAGTSIRSVMHDFAGMQPQLDSATAATVQAQIANAQSVFAQASADLAAGNQSAAKSQFSAVIRMTVKLDTYLTIGKKINIKLLQGLLNVSTSGSSSNNGPDTDKGNSASGASTMQASTTNSGDGSSKGPDDGDGVDLRL